jgi:hypothetical protein
MCGKDGMGGSNQEGLRVFGVPLHQLAVGDGKVPIVVDRLITTIEMYGLYTEGIYRKSGVGITCNLLLNKCVIGIGNLRLSQWCF